MNITTNKLIKFQEISAKITSDIINLAKKNAMYNDDVFASFIKEFYLLLPLENLAHHSNENLLNIVKQSYDFMLLRKSFSPKIRVFNSDIENTFYQKFTTLEILSNNMPFLLHSLQATLAANEIKIYEIIHPVFHIVRDQNGKLTDIDTQAKSYTHQESFIHLHIEKIETQEKIQELINVVENTINNVGAAFDDWSKIINVLDEATVLAANSSVSQILQWMKSHHFTFLGYVQYDFDQHERANIVSDTSLGIFNSNIIEKNAKIAAESLKFANNIYKLKQDNEPVNIVKINMISPVYRNDNIDYVGVKIFDEKSQLKSLRVFVGLFTSTLYYQSINTIPLIKEKTAQVISNIGFMEKSFSDKQLKTILESLPREELFKLSLEKLYQIALEVYSLTIKPQVKLFAIENLIDNSISCLIFIPKQNYTGDVKNKISKILIQHLGQGVVVVKDNQAIHLSMAMLYAIFTSSSSPNLSAETLVNIENAIKDHVKLWHEDLQELLDLEFNASKSKLLYQKYHNAFPITYKERFAIGQCVLKDITLIEKALDTKKPIFDLYQMHSDINNDSFGLNVYSATRKILLAEIMPIFDNMSFAADEESTFAIEFENGQIVWMHNFQFSITSYHTKSITELKEYEILEGATIKLLVEEALEQIWENNVQNDSLNRLILRAGLNWREVVLIRTIAKYIRQTGFIYGSEYVESVITSHPQLAKLMVALFYARLSPQNNNAQPHKLEEMKNTLTQAVAAGEDKVIRRFFEVINAIVRTNYFQKNEAGEFKNYISIKINSSMISNLPKPVPFREIFVYSARVEGIHLRGGKVARGGIRWSDRGEDYRTEVLGLMKAQMTKNSVIVPVGSKGGFVVKQSMLLVGRDEYFKEGIKCYEIFLSGLLDITDNIIDNKVIKPKDVVCLDDDDPYLVVAADKGTATFSDIANKVSAKYGFWLGDAFASGGSAGYDHKKMAITARGGWISVKRHFLEMGIDIQTQDFTAVGIGDMSGDVFGNAMLLSEHICLIGAFNHLHIFVDPKPNSKTSFLERKRLFNLSCSSWSDYDLTTLSKGGAVFDRKAKILELSDEIREVLEIEDNKITPDDLIKKIITAKVDLLWNGGIGTYCKSATETNQQIGDKSNDNLRVDGIDLRCKVVGEGGNLGFSQLGRIEYAKNGGRINTDAIDNSAGVDCSDHEVNIKIALANAMAQGTLTLDERDEILSQMTDEVAQLVLRDNRLQTQAITIAQQQGNATLELNARLINRLESIGALDREVEFLPSAKELVKINAAKLGLSRPEIAVLLAYSKITVYEDILNSDLPDDQYCQNDLLLYFPRYMQQRFAVDIASHKLRREIISTAITNSMVNRVGTFFYHFAQEDTGMKGSDIARAYTITRDSLNLRKIWQEIEDLDGVIDVHHQVELFTSINKLISRYVFWLLRNQLHNLNISHNIGVLKPALEEIVQNIEICITGMSKNKFYDKLNYYKNLKISPSLATTMATISVISPACDMVSVAHKNNLSVIKAAQLYFQVGDTFKFDFLRAAIDKISMNSYWERLSLKSLKDDLYDQQRALTSDIIEKVGFIPEAIKEWSQLKQKQVQRYNEFIADLINLEVLDPAMVVVAAKRINLLVV
jgi:glutamate dehydrogenase